MAMHRRRRLCRSGSTNSWGSATGRCSVGGSRRSPHAHTRVGRAARAAPCPRDQWRNSAPTTRLGRRSGAPSFRVHARRRPVRTFRVPSARREDLDRIRPSGVHRPTPRGMSRTSGASLSAARPRRRAPDRRQLREGPGLALPAVRHGPRSPSAGVPAHSGARRYRLAAPSVLRSSPT